MNTSNLRTIVRGAYDVQKLRIQMGNRIVGNFKAKLGQKPSESEEEIDDDGKQILSSLRAVYKKITDGVKTFPRQSTFVGNEIISDYTELCLIAQYIELEKQEDQHFRRLGSIIEEYPIYSGFLADIKGIGPAMAGVLLSEIDLTKAKYPSSVWKYAGLDVADDGRGRSKRKEHLVEVEYTNAAGEPKKRMGITYNPFLKTKLVGVLASSFLRAGENPYSTIYRDYKHRMENHVKYGVINDKKKNEDGRMITWPGLRHKMAMRYMIKMFLLDYYKEGRAILGLPVAPPYSEAKLGMKAHGQAARVGQKNRDNQPLQACH